MIPYIEKRYQKICKRTSIPICDLLEGYEFLFDNTYFQFNGKYYQQVYGAPMSQSTSCLFADIVMDDLESECLKTLSFTPLFYHRYVDYTTTCVPENKIDEIVNEFNSYTDRLQFTYEVEMNNRLRS